jgi:tungstate transport system substrate-binding protein
MAEAKAPESKILRMASTTSTDNTGLLSYLASLFEKESGIQLQWVATGTGRAIELGRHCDVDVLLVHAPEAEKEFMDSGFGKDRRDVMYNDFVLVGPMDDPAGVRGMEIHDGLKRIAEEKSPFVSRGDESGTHKREETLWRESGRGSPSASDWYIMADKGMRDSLDIAAERRAYILCDRGTFLSYSAQESKGKAPFAMLIEEGEHLRNQYDVIALNPDKCKHARYDMAKQFIDWITSAKGQAAIADFRMQGRQLFTPNARK